jgi:hypothetical protein
VRCRILCGAPSAMDRTKVSKAHHFNSTEPEHQREPTKRHCAETGCCSLLKSAANRGELTRDIFSKPCGEGTVRLLGRRGCSITRIPCRQPLRDFRLPQAAGGCRAKNCLTQQELAPLNYFTFGAVADQTYSQNGPGRKAGLFMLLQF